MGINILIKKGLNLTMEADSGKVVKIRAASSIRIST